MAGESTEGTSTESTGAATAGQQQTTTPETGANGSQQQPQITAETRLPDNHPLIAAYTRVKSENETLKATKAEADKVPGLTSELETAKQQAAKVAPLEARTARLEAFLTEIGGPVAQILDSRTFSARLFESEEKIEDIVKAWHQANPSATAQALGGGGGAVSDKKPTQNELLRAAIARG